MFRLRDCVQAEIIYIQKVHSRLYRLRTVFWTLFSVSCFVRAALTLCTRDVTFYEGGKVASEPFYLDFKRPSIQILPKFVETQQTKCVLFGIGKRAE